MATTTGTILRGVSGAGFVASTSTYPDTNAVSTLLYASSANVMSALSTANNGALITSNTGVPSILAESATAGIPLVSGGTGVPPAWTTAVVAGGGTGATTLTGVLTGNGTGAVTANAVTQYGVLVGGASNAVSSTAVGTATHVLTSNGAGVAPTFQVAPGAAFVKQVRATKNTIVNCSTVMPYDDSIPQNGEGDEVLTVAITPSSASNILVIQWTGFVGTSTSEMGSAALFQDSTAGALNASSSYLGTVSLADTLTLTHTMTAGTTSSTTFKIRIGPNSAGTITLNGTNSARLFGGVATSVLLVSEYTA